MKKAAPQPRGGRPPSLNANECRAARALLGITQSIFAAKADIALSTLVDFEKQRRKVSRAVVIDIKRTLEALGVEFIRKTGARGLRLSETAESNALGIATNQLKAARALLSWNQTDLADECGLAFKTVRRIETIGCRSYVSTVERIMQTLRAHGIELISGGVILKGKHARV